MKPTKLLEFPLTQIDVSAGAKKREEVANRLITFSKQLCGRYLNKERNKAAETVLSAAFIEWAVADNPGITEFSDLLFAVEACLTDYDMSTHDYYAGQAYKGGANGMLVSLNMQALSKQSEGAVLRAASDAYEVVFGYMVEKGLIQKSQKPSAMY